MNKVILLGYISSEPESRKFDSKFKNEESMFAKLSIAVNDGRNRSTSYFINCTAWNQTAIYISEKLHKGDFVAVDGRLTNRNYVNNEGKKVYLTEVVIDNITNYGSRKSDNKLPTLEVDKINIDSMLNKEEIKKEVSSHSDSDSDDWESELE